ncbi:hypothetical protein BC831DRAFT_268971 [Entophlyctis helioformis]|nr:hypothetical protein BC831DRAFT_268971 [Entophlyctis helioformis]
MSNTTLLQQDCAVLRNLWPAMFPADKDCCDFTDKRAQCTKTRIAAISATDGNGTTVDNAFPVQLTALTGLQNIFLNNNSYTSIPDNIFANFTNLAVVNLDDNKFTGLPIPSSLINKPRLKFLSFSNNGMVGEIPNFENSKNLTYLYVFLHSSLRLNSHNALHC